VYHLIPLQPKYDKYGKGLGPLYLFYDEELQYFWEEHLPYAILAVIITLVFNILPLLLLLLYPFQCFQQCLSTCRLRWHGLPIFIDAFQGCYKNGTETFALIFIMALLPLVYITSIVLQWLFRRRRVQQKLHQRF